MSDFKPIKDIQLTNNIINKVSNHFKWSSFSKGLNRVSVTKYGGVHFTGKAELRKCISFEITRKNVYIMISLFEYPKGVMFHPHIFYPQINKLSKDQLDIVLNDVYEEIKKVIEEKE